jgi:23S rRNA (pseudouridine1915-N3)-methyltransferase
MPEHPMKIRVISIGRKEDEFVRLGADRFLKRIRVYHPLEEIRLKEWKAGKGAETRKVLEEEGARILNAIDAKDRVCVLDRQGEGMTSEAFASFLEKEFLGPGRYLGFVIGGAEGICEAVRQRADRTLSFSPMTFTHELSRLLLLEQIYRGLTILNGKRYHR